MKCNHRFQLIVLAGFSILVVNGCQTQDALTPQDGTQTETPAIIRTMAPIITSTSTVMPSPTVTRNPTLSADQLLDERNPTLGQIWAYLGNVVPASRPDQPWDSVDQRYKDVSGDRIEDLVLVSNKFVVMQVWEDNHYGHPFVLNLDFRKYDPSSRVFFEDWTFDGVPEIIVDERNDAGGTGVLVKEWKRHIIGCQDGDCRLLWSSPTGLVIDDANFGGFLILNVTVQNRLDENNNPEIVRKSAGFSFYCCSLMEDVSIDDRLALRIYTPEEMIYSWGGTSFTLTDQISGEEIDTIRDRSNLSAIRTDGLRAEIKVEENHLLMPYGNDDCQILLDGKSIREGIPCKSSFSTLQWVDLTGNGQDDLVFISASGQFDAMTDEFISNCVHQRLLAYTIGPESVTEIADVKGCIVDEDLFGVRIENRDQDGRYEIFAAQFAPQPQDACFFEVEGELPDGSLYTERSNCWYEPPQNQIVINVFSFDGTTFVNTDSYTQ